MQIGAKATVIYSLGTNYMFIPGLCANQGDHSNRGPAIKNGTKQQSRSTCCVIWHYGSRHSTSICLLNFPESFKQ